MGRIKTTLTKRTTLTLLKKYPNSFKPDFDENKKVLHEVVEMESKRLRNVIAGYLTRLVKKEINDINRIEGVQ